MRDHFQQSIAYVVTQGIVDILELVQIDKQNGKFRAGPLCCHNGLLYPVLHQQPVGQIGQRIKMRQMDDFGFGRLARGDIAHDADELALPLQVKLGNPQFHRENFAVAALCHQLSA